MTLKENVLTIFTNEQERKILTGAKQLQFVIFKADCRLDQYTTVNASPNEFKVEKVKGTLIGTISLSFFELGKIIKGEWAHFPPNDTNF